MIDIHSHIVFDVDDGPTTIEEILALVGESYRQGVRTIVSTSHRRKGMFETPEDKIFANFSQVKEAAEAKYEGLEILYGGELYYSSDILERLEQRQVPRMNDTCFALIEFSMTTPWKEIHTALSNVIMLGITPVVAHIERYNALEFNEERVKEWINMGGTHKLIAHMFSNQNYLVINTVNSKNEHVISWKKILFIVSQAICITLDQDRHLWMKLGKSLQKILDQIGHMLFSREILKPY